MTINVSKARDPRFLAKCKSTLHVRQPNHPEIREGEIWYRNCTEATFSKIKWSTKRRGIIARTSGGLQTGGPELFPVFVQRKELELGGLKLVPHSERRGW